MTITPKMKLRALAAATVGLVAAQPTTTVGGCDASGKQQIAMVNWFGASNCQARGGPTEHRTIVSAPLDICVSKRAILYIDDIMSIL